MSRSLTAPDDRDVDSDSSAIDTATKNGDRSQAPVRHHTVLQLLNTTPKFSALRLHPDVEESRCTDHVVDTIKVADGGKGHDVHDVSEASVDKISTSENNPHEINKDVGHSSSDSFPYDSTSSPQTAKIRAKDRNDNSTSILLATSSIGSNANKNDSPNSYDNKEEIKITGSLASLPAHVQHYSDVTDELTHPFSNAGIGMEGAMETLSSTDGDHLSFIPCSLHNYTCADGRMSRKNAAIVVHAHVQQHCDVSELEHPCLAADLSIEGAIETMSSTDEYHLSRIHSSLHNDASTDRQESKKNSAIVAPEYVSPCCDIPDELQPPCANTDTGIEKAKEAEKNADGQRSKGIAPIVTLRSTNEESPPTPLSICLADNAPTEKKNGNHSIAGVNPEHSTGTVVQKPRAAESNNMNQGNTLFNENFLRQPRTMVPELSGDYVLHFSPPIIQREDDIPPVTNVPTQSVQHDSVHEEDTADAVVVHEAFLVEENVTLDVENVRFAELVEPDHSTVPRSRSIRNAIEMNVLLRNAIFDEMESTDHRILALHWISDKDQMKLVESDPNLSQRYVLALLAYAFSINSSWLSDDSECEWFGVKCNKYQQVIALEIDDFKLHGTMPPEVGRLQYLQMISFGSNSLHGTLPSEIGTLKDLSSLSISGNFFSGTLPSEIVNLTEMTKLDVSWNSFNDTFPSTLLMLTSLTHLYMRGNQFTGNLPSKLENLTTLAVLELSANWFTGFVPSQVGGLGNLTTFRIARNQFTGTIPSDLGRLTSLTSLDVSCNYFSGTFPSQIGDLKNLSELLIGYNEFSGTFPSESANNLNLK
ncbi:hypothetical protein HJC23_002677, partial [Cyclotella cryptica]